MIVDPAIEAHLRALQDAGGPVLEEMELEGRRRGFPIIGPLVGRLCEQAARSIGARRVFEMGSGFGYSTAWFARAVGEDGEVVHTDDDPALGEEARGWLERAGLADRVRFATGDALDLIAAEEGDFDVVFIDVDKGDYPRAWRLARDRVRRGGLVIMDNMLWSGKVADPAVDDEWTEAVRESARLAMADKAYLAQVLPVRDGVLLALRVA